jgi:hypothetical protein
LIGVVSLAGLAHALAFWALIVGLGTIVVVW